MKKLKERWIWCSNMACEIFLFAIKINNYLKL